MKNKQEINKKEKEKKKKKKNQLCLYATFDNSAVMKSNAASLVSAAV